VYGYLRKFKHGAIRFRTGMPDYSELGKVQCNWDYSIYTHNAGSVVNDFQPTDLPPALGGAVITTTYVDANLLHCLVTGQLSTGILHLVNGTSIDWYSKHQSTVKTATYGSKFVAARIATNQVTNMQLTLAYLGISIQRLVMFGNNQLVITSSTMPQSKLNKRHILLAYHCVREAISRRVLEFHYIDGTINPADMLSKYAGYQQFWPILRSLLFWGVSFDRQLDYVGEADDGNNDQDHGNIATTANVTKAHLITCKMVRSDTLGPSYYLYCN
jgi:hypothetical protein